FWTVSSASAACCNCSAGFWVGADMGFTSSLVVLCLFLKTLNLLTLSPKFKRKSVGSHHASCPSLAKPSGKISDSQRTATNYLPVNGSGEIARRFLFIMAPVSGGCSPKPTV
ncbi:MAG TPA: hypothetical protein PK880_14335, partial [Candidatus Competibacter sp.]|nr:hypothetical protein [Candidatus Competibacter sp.]